MQKSFFLLGFFLLSLFSVGQSDSASKAIIAGPGEVDQLPVIDMAALNKCAQFPASCQNITGTVIVECTVNPDGTFSDMRVVRKLHPAADELALKVLGCAQPATPALKEEKPVACKMVIPIKFTLQ